MSTDYTDSEREYFQTGDASRVMAEEGRRPESHTNGPPELTPGEEHYMRSGGDTSVYLAEQEAAEPTIEDRINALPPAAQEMFRRNLGGAVNEFQDMKRGRVEDQIARARAETQRDLLVETLSPQEPEPAYDPNDPNDVDGPNPLPGFRDPTKDIIGFAEDAREYLRGLRDIETYNANLSNFARHYPDFNAAYQFNLASRGRELLSRQYPQASAQQIENHVRLYGFPDDVVAQIQAEERATYVNDPDAAPAKIWRQAQIRGWRSQSEIKAAQDAYKEQQRQEAARRDAQQRAAEAKEQSWRDGIARKVAAIPGKSFHDALREVLIRPEDRRRYYDRSSQNYQTGSW
jgi:hypothetical protein